MMNVLSLQQLIPPAEPPCEGVLASCGSSTCSGCSCASNGCGTRGAL